MELTKLRLCVENCCDVLQVLESIDCMDLQVGGPNGWLVEAENTYILNSPLQKRNFAPELKHDFQVLAVNLPGCMLGDFVVL